MATPVVQSAPFFKLSGELRNTIYRFATVEPQTIQVTSDGFNKSGLLATCKEIREEAIKIFYVENTFHHLIDNFDSRTMVKLNALWQPVAGDATPGTSISASLRWSPHWENLLVWLKRIHAGKCHGGHIGLETLNERGERAVDIYMVEAMFETVLRMQRQPWALVKDIVEINRVALVVRDKRWG